MAEVDHSQVLEEHFDSRNEKTKEEGNWGRMPVNGMIGHLEVIGECRDWEHTVKKTQGKWDCEYQE